MLGHFRHLCVLIQLHSVFVKFVYKGVFDSDHTYMNLVYNA